MTSWPTRKLYHFLDIGSYCKFVPYYLDLREYSYMTVVDEESGQKTYNPFVIWGDARHQTLYLGVNAFTLIAQALGIGAGVWYNLTFELSLLDRLQFYFICCVEALFALLQLAVLLFSRRLFDMQNTYFLFNLKLYEVHKLDKWEKDGVEVYLKLMIGLLGVCSLLAPIWCLYMNVNVYKFLEDMELIHLNIPELQRWVLSFVSHLATTALFAFLVLQGHVNVLHFVSMALSYCSAVVRCVKLSSYKSQSKMLGVGHRISPERKYELTTYYKAHQIYHNYVMEEASKIVLASIAFVAGIMILSLFSLIVFYRHFIISLIIIAGLTVVDSLIMTETLFKLANYVTDISLEFKNSYLRNDFSLNKFERLRFKSCRGLDIYAGTLFKVSRHTYITFLYDVVLTNVITLLIEFGN